MSKGDLVAVAKGPTHMPKDQLDFLILLRATVTPASKDMTLKSSSMTET